MLKSLLNQIIRNTRDMAHQHEEVSTQFKILQELVRGLPSLLTAPVQHTPLSESLFKIMEELSDFLFANTRALEAVQKKQTKTEEKLANMEKILHRLEKKIDRLQQEQAVSGKQVQEVHQLFLVDD